MSGGLIWAALFNTWPDTSGDSFLVDVITEMGRAAIMEKIILAGVGLIILLIGTALLLRWKRRKKLPGDDKKKIQ